MRPRAARTTFSFASTPRSPPPNDHPRDGQPAAAAQETPLPLSSEELLEQLRATDRLLAEAASVCSAADAERSDCIRRLEGQARSLRSLLVGDAVTVVEDAVDAARVLLADDADAAQALRLLSIARNTLHAVIHRQADRLRLAEAA
jgi:hypothetical protein